MRWPRRGQFPCRYIKKLEGVHIPTLKKLIKKAYKSPEIKGATTTDRHGK